MTSFVITFNAINVSKNLYTQVEEMLTQFEKKHDVEYFYSAYVSNITRGVTFHSLLVTRRKVIRRLL